MTIISQQPVRFDDGQAYDRWMGAWSQLVGQIFIDWLTPPPRQRWIDIGCGSGAFSELLIQHCAPADLQGVDPSEEQLVFARSRPGAQGATFLQGDAMALPFDDNRFDTAVMALVLFFVPDPAKSVAEMKRVTCPGGTVAAYVWDALNDASPTNPIQAEFRAWGMPTTLPPRADISHMTALRDLWIGAGLEAVETREITVQRSFADFEDFWHSIIGMPLVKHKLSTLAAGKVEQLKAQMRKRPFVDAAGGVTYQARANAIKGRVPVSR